MPERFSFFIYLANSKIYFTYKKNQHFNLKNENGMTQLVLLLFKIKLNSWRVGIPTDEQQFSIIFFFSFKDQICKNRQHLTLVNDGLVNCIVS